MRIGLFGGTFNPVHLGHLRAALEVKEGFELDMVYFIPSALPPHKETTDMADAVDRFEMVRLAVSNSPDFTVSDVELKRSGSSYTIDTVNYFKSVSPKGADLFFILGLDACLEIDTWKSYQKLLELVPFIVLMRPDEKCNDTEKKQKILYRYLKNRISDGYTYSSLRSCYVHHKNKPVFIFNVTLLSISSTIVRRYIKKKRSIQFLLPDSVKDFIKTKGLYL